MKLNTVKLRHKRKGKTLIVNEYDWACDLGRYQFREYERIDGGSYGDPFKKITDAISGESVTITQDEAQKANADISPQARRQQEERVAKIERRKRRRKESLPEVTDKE